MWTATINRDELLSIVQRDELKGYQLRQISSLKGLESPVERVVAIWEEKPDGSGLPDLIVVPEKEKVDFFAWCSTYLKVKPLTAFVRTLGYETFCKIAETPKPTNDKWRYGLAGLVLAEAFTYLDQPASKVSLRACEGTYSFAAARCLMRGQGVSGIRQTGLNWFRSREALGNRASRLALSDLDSVWDVLKELVGPDFVEGSTPQSVVQSCKSLAQHGDISDADWRSLTREMPSVYDLRVVMQNTREERVMVLETLLRSLSSRLYATTELAFLIGYLLSLVAPGTLDHWRLLDPIRQSLPTTGLWYGLCASLPPHSSVDSFAGGMGRLVIRELQRKMDLLERPSCDIAVDELDVTGPFFRSDGTTMANTIEVEIHPGVSVPFRANGKDESKLDFQLNPSPTRFSELELSPRIVDGLDDALYTLQEVRREIERAFPNARSGYTGKSRKKRRT